ncbi:hypothetical protein OJAV_G00208610 [Oryzias javanicus]|uniref:Uncharacterized protein n=1 Tax=Oryzias javanicus TaxID=123683 RepID=A0A3S2NSN7_ORYJA|nr:hypothetical protein OJAV_G00208610 [Oryzias javanicus]
MSGNNRFMHDETALLQTPFWFFLCVGLNWVFEATLNQNEAVSQRNATNVNRVRIESWIFVRQLYIMATMTTVKPFTSEEAGRILHHLQQPAVFLNMTCDWPVLLWTAEHLSSCLGDRLVRFRLGRKQKTNAPLFETQCS